MNDTVKSILKSVGVVFVCFLIWGIDSRIKRNGANPDIHYVSERCIVVNTGLYSSKMNDVFDTPYVAKFFLIRRINDTTMYTEINSQNWNGCKGTWGLSDSLYYNVKIGDTLRFDYISKKRFFKITAR